MDKQMPETDSRVPSITTWGFVKLTLKTHMLANIFFGLPLIVITLLSQGLSYLTILKLVLFYTSVYALVYIPLYVLIPSFFLGSVNKPFGKMRRGETPELKEISATLELLLNLPIKIAAIIALITPPGFVLGVWLLRLGLIPELLPLMNIFTWVGILIGCMVAAIHSLLMYIFSESYFRPAVEFLVSVSSLGLRDLKILKSSIFAKILFLVLLSVLAGQASLGVFLLSQIATAIPNEFAKSLLYVFYISVLSFSFVVIIAATFARNIAYSLKQLIHWADQITKGDFKKKINVMTNDEISEVVEYLKEMVRQLEESRSLLEVRVEARTRELKELADNLEEQVKERTKELQQRLDDVEKFNRLTIDRELKMTELKTEIAELKTELDKARQTGKEKD